MNFPPLTEQHCSNCRYVSPHSHPDLRLCRRHAPQVGPYGGQWPTTTSDQWCGEWVQGEVEQ